MREHMAQLAYNRITLTYQDPLTCYVYYPKNALNAQWQVLNYYPGVVMLHGGGWAGGSKAAIEALCIALCKRGAVVMSIDYTLATEAGMPTLGATMGNIDNALTLMRALGCVAGKPITLAGVSAGGHLANMYTMLAATNLPDKLVTMSAPVDLRLCNETILHDALLWMLGATDTETLEENSPLLMQPNSDVEQLSIWGGQDPLLSLMSRHEYMTVLGGIPVSGGVLLPGADHEMDGAIEEWASIVAAWVGCPQP